MPAVKRKSLKQRIDVTTLTPAMRRRLEDGHFWFGECPFTHNAELFKEAWKIHRDEILPAFIAENPGRRPLGWWVCSHKRERPILDQGPLTEKTIEGYRKSRFNFLDTEISFPRDGEILDFQEREIDYLRRNGLLSEEEHIRIREAVGNNKRLETCVSNFDFTALRQLTQDTCPEEAVFQTEK